MNKVPKQIIVEVTQRCNLQCKFCPNLTCDDNTDMSFEFFKEIIDKIDVPGITVIPWMNGEPLLHPDYAKMLDYIGERGYRCYVTTNGMIYRDDVAMALRQWSSIYQLIVSFDGLYHNNQTDLPAVTVARPGTDPKRVYSSILNYRNLAWNYAGTGVPVIDEGKKAFDVAVKICNRGQDWEEIENYIKFWARQVDFVVVGKRLGEENDVSMRAYPCQYFDHNFIVIRADGSLVPCAYHDDMVNKGAYPLGNIGDFKTITDAYNNPRYQELRRLHHEGDFPSPCNLCGFAYTGSGFRGEVQFPGGLRLYYHQDYYNEFFSLVQKWKPWSYYETT